jgi:hypothetical protein
MDAVTVCGVISQPGMMTSRATPTGLPGHDQHVRATAPTAHERSGQGRGDPGATTPDHHPGTPAGRGSAAVLPRRPSVPHGSAAPHPDSDASSAPAAGMSGNCAALASGPPRAPPRRQFPSQTPGPPTNRPLDPPAGTTSCAGEPRLGISPHPRRTTRTRSQGRRLHRLADPHRRRNQPSRRSHLDQRGRPSSAPRPALYSPATSSRSSP